MLYKKEKNHNVSVYSKKVAFTLAEVLITLGIIGVVAAMTIPVLIQNYNARVWNTSATVFKKKLEESLKTMNTQQTLIGHQSTKSFVEELSKHYKISKICENDKLLDCFSDTIYWGAAAATPEELDMSVVKKSRSFGQADWQTEVIGVQFANGTNALIAYNPITYSDDPTVKVCKQDPYSNQVNVTDCLAVLYDVSGFKAPNSRGKDIGVINVANLGSGCTFEVGGSCFTTAPFSPTAVSKEECESMMASHGIQACSYASDYWAGAVKACGGVDKLPTEKQLDDFSDYIYNTTGVSGAYTPNLSWDLDRVAALGFDISKYNAFILWSGVEDNGSKAYIREFGPVHTGWGSIGRNNYSILQAICIEN